MSLIVTGAPAEEPISISDLQTWCKSTEEAEADTLASLISEAREHVEGWINQSLAPQTLAARWDCFPCWTLELERPPVTSVTSIQYVDTDGVTQTLSPSLYQVDIYSSPARITPAYGQVWPWTRPQMNAVIVSYVAGYASPDLVPGPIRRAIALLAAHLFENREAVIVGPGAIEMPLSVRDLLMPHKVWS